MNEQQVNALIAALQEETKAKKEQTAALTRTAESNESLVAVLVDAFSNDMGDVDIIKKMRTKTISAIGVIMQAGKLRHRITLQKPVKVQDPETGSVENIWQDLAQLWAEVSPLSAREFVSARQCKMPSLQGLLSATVKTSSQNIGYCFAVKYSTLKVFCPIRKVALNI